MFKTDWICILTAGNTVDGREISQVIVDQCAETYDPKTYNARININHSHGSYSQKVGSVLAVKVEGAKLLAQLKPNAIFLSLMQNGQYLHTSCEIQPNFAKTGKAYLTGLALTDEPASLGTDELHLSTQQPGVELLTSNEMLTPEKPSLLEKLFKKKDDDMTDKATLELLMAMQAAQDKTTATLTSLAESMGTLTEELSVKSGETPAPKKEEADPLAELTAKIGTLTEQLATQKTELSALTEKLAKQDDEPHRNQATGGDGELDDVL